MKIPCDGCRVEMEADGLAYIIALAHEVKYCPDCAQVWQAFETASRAYAQMKQREIDLWEQDARAKLQLAITPLDFPRVPMGEGQPVMVAHGLNGRPLVLG